MRDGLVFYIPLQSCLETASVYRAFNPESSRSRAFRGVTYFDECPGAEMGITPPVTPVSPLSVSLT